MHRKTMAQKKLVPPDGGWGYAIIIAYALNQFLIFPMLQGFGLIYRNIFAELGFSATDCTVIMNSGVAVSMLSGIFVGPLLNFYGYRKVAIVGAALMTIGAVITAYGSNFVYFMITYGLVTCLGMGLSFSAYPLALNTYFLNKRSKASGYAMSLGALGAILMPQLIAFLMDTYDTRSAAALVGIIIGNMIAGALLLQPVEWHMVIELGDEEETAQKQDLLNEDYHEDLRGVCEMTSTLTGSHVCLSAYSNQTSSRCRVPNRRHSSSRIIKLKMESTCLEGAENEGTNTEYQESKLVEAPAKTSLCGRFLRTTVRILDLSLMKDLVLVNIMFGMSFAVFAELNFTMLVPFIMADYGLNSHQTATFVSTLSIVDICSRFLSPYIGNSLKQPPRIMYMIALILLIVFRSCLFFFESYISLLVIAAGLGMSKGIVVVYWALVIPSHVPIERLATAIGLQFALNGIFMCLGGPALGFIRDVTGSYKDCIHSINLVTLLTLIIWSTEFMYISFKKKKKIVNTPL